MSDYNFECKFKYNENKNLDLKLVKLQKRLFYVSARRYKLASFVQAGFKKLLLKFNKF